MASNFLHFVKYKWLWLPIVLILICRHLPRESSDGNYTQKNAFFPSCNTKPGFQNCLISGRRNKASLYPQQEAWNVSKRYLSNRWMVYCICIASEELTAWLFGLYNVPCRTAEGDPDPWSASFCIRRCKLCVAICYSTSPIYETPRSRN